MCGIREAKSQKARVVVGCVSVEGIVDTGADITIMSGDIFKHVAVVGKLRKRDFKAVHNTSHNYDCKPYRVNSRLDLDVTFQDLTMNTPVYVKMDAPESLLLSEGVCQQLSIVTYHPDIQTKINLMVA